MAFSDEETVESSPALVKDRRHLESRKSRLLNELICIEQSLSKRRAELYEADRLLLRSEQELHQAQTQVAHYLLTGNFDSVDILFYCTVYMFVCFLLLLI